MDDDVGAGASYLASLKQSRIPQAAAAKPALSSDPRPAPGLGAAATSRERRKNPRYRCQGSVQLREGRGNVATWATFSDISLDGCYIEAPSAFGVGTQLNLTIDVNGLRFETAAEVRATYPSLGMGIAFGPMTPADRAKLSSLIASIPQRAIIPGSRVTTQSLSGSPAAIPPVITNPAAALYAIEKFFENRRMLDREEFLRILRNSQ